MIKDISDNKLGQNKPMLVTWSAEDQQSKENWAASYTIPDPAYHRARGGTTYTDVAPNVSLRDAYSKNDYGRYRIDDVVPTSYKEVMKICNAAYKKIGIIRNIIDLMGDFTCEGIKIVHSNKKNERFLRYWAKQVDFIERSERFSNKLYRYANVIVNRMTGKLTVRQVEKFNKSQATPDKEFEEQFLEIERREIPLNYTFLNPNNIEIIEEELWKFIGGEPQYGIRIPSRLVNKIKGPKNNYQKELIKNIPSYILKVIRNGKSGVVPLSKEKTLVFHYKKDDWEPWAHPFMYSVLDDLILLEKLKLADLTAADSAIRNIRIWNIGDYEHDIYPNSEAFTRLRDILQSGVPGGQMDLVWGPELKVTQVDNNLHQFLGETKYIPALNLIRDGLGFPSTLSGSSSQGGFTNNFFSLKVLMQRLEYGRMILNMFWQNEMELIQKAMGWQSPGQVIYKHMNLSDEVAEKALLLQMVDRDLISVEEIQERFGEIPELEKLRMKREAKERQSGKMMPKARPWQSQEEKLKSIALQSGVSTPSEVGLELMENKEGQTPALKMKQVQTGQKGAQQQGRPLNTKDSSKRKSRRVTPKTKADFPVVVALAKKSQDLISEVVNPIFLKIYGRKNVRSFTDEEFSNVEQFKFAVLANIDIDSITKESILQVIKEKPQIWPEMYQYKSEALKRISKDKVDIDCVRNIQAMAYATLYCDE